MSNKANNEEIKKLKNPTFQVTVLDSWFINYQKRGNVLPHVHGNCSWCCVYYVQLGKDANSTNGATYFQRPIPFRTQTDFGSLYNKSLILSATPEEGKLVYCRLRTPYLADLVGAQQPAARACAQRSGSGPLRAVIYR